jgi:chromosome segregation ATPase
MNVLADEKQRLGRLETENSDQIAEINGLKETITTRLSSDYVPGVSRSFDSLLFDKQREIDNLRKEIRGGNFGEDIKTNHVLHQEKDVELNELRPLRGEVEILRQALAEAKEEITRVEEETRDKGVADQRRRNEERTSLLIGRSEEISVLKDKHASKVTALEFRLKERVEEINIQKNKIADLNAQLHKAKRSLTSSHKTHQPQSPARPVIEAPRQRFNGMNSKQNTFTENEDYLRRSLDEKDQECRDLQQNFMILAKQYKEKVEELEKLESQITNEKEHCENEKNLLRRRIVELERALEVAQIHGSQPSTITGPTTNELQYGSTIPESSSKAHEISKTQLEKQIVDLQEANEAMAFIETNLRTQIASLSKDIQTKEVREHELSTQASKSREQLQAKCAQEQVLFSQVATLTQQRDAAVEETTGVKKQLEEAMSKGEAVWGELQELKVARNNNETAQRNQDMGKLEKSNIDLQGQCDQLRQQGMHEINSRDRQIQKLRTDAATGNQTIHDLEQRLLVLKAENNTQSQVIRALKNELQAEKDRYLIDVNDLKNDVDHAQRETEKEKHGRKDDVRLAREREAKAIDEVRRERQQEIDDLKNSQESSTIKKLQERVEFYQMENTDLLKNGKEGWKNLLLRKNQEIQKKESEISSANSRIRHWHRLYNIFHRRFEGLQGNKAYKEGEVSYAEARAGLFMGNDSHISTAMEKCVKFTEDLEAEVGRLKEEVERLRKYDEKVVEEEMNMDETIE